MQLDSMFENLNLENSFSATSLLLSTPSSVVQLAHKYRTGIDGIKQDYKEAARLYQVAAQQGDTDGESWLAFLYLNKWGGLNNDTEAFRLSKLGVEKKKSTRV